MKDRIKAIRQALGLSQKEFAEKMHLATNYISLIETGKNGVTDKYIYRVCEAFNANEVWIRQGGDKINMFIEPTPTNPNTQKLLEIVSNMSDEQIKQVYAVVKALYNEEKDQRN